MPKLVLFRRVLLALLLVLGLLLALVLGGSAWLLGSIDGNQQIERWVRERLSGNSDLVLAPFTVRLSPWRDFPYPSATIRHLSLTDTTHGRAVEVLRLARADLRLELGALLHGRVRVTRLVADSLLIEEQVDSLGRRWGLHGRARRTAVRVPTVRFSLDSVVLRHFQIKTRNDYAHSGFVARAARAGLAVALRHGQLRLQGTLGGQLVELRNATGTLFRHEPVRARVRYRYDFAQRRGTFSRTHFTLNGDTIRLRGTHTVDASRPTGTLLHLDFAGTQPVLEILGAVLPPRLRPFLAGAQSPSKARITYQIAGLSGPTDRPRVRLRFGLRNARVDWPQDARRISRWDLQGTYDNGAEHRLATTRLTLDQCRIYTSAGRLDVGLSISNFLEPVVSHGHVRGRTELRELATLVAPGEWRARQGRADLDLTFGGRLPAGIIRPQPGQPTPVFDVNKLNVKGVVQLHDASFVLVDRQADMRALNVRIRLRGADWQLDSASGVLDGMRFQASARTVGLFQFLTGKRATTSVRGQFAVDELLVPRLRELLRPMPRRRRGRGPAPTAQELVASMGSSLIPKGMFLQVGLRCGRLVLGADTLRDLAVTVQHDGQRVILSNLAGQVWQAEVSGRVAWPTDPAADVVPVDFQLQVHFPRLNYARLLERLTRPPRRPRPAPNARGGRPPANPALRELLLAANGQAECRIDELELPGEENLKALTLSLFKDGSTLRMPMLRFDLPQGGSGQASAQAQVSGLRLTSATADISLKYKLLNVQELFELLADFTVPLPRRRAQPADGEAAAPRRPGRAARREGGADEPASILTNGLLTARLRVEADQIRYAAFAGSDFHLRTQLRPGVADVEDCAFQALGGQFSVRGRLRSAAGQPEHPLHVQMLLENVQLPALFASATGMGLKVLDSENIQGRLRCVADLRTTLNARFLPAFAQTRGYLRADLRNLELIEVAPLQSALKFMRKERTSHLRFDPVSAEFVLDQGLLLIPYFPLNSNLTNLELTGYYGLDGRADLYLGINPLQTLFGSNRKRLGRIENDEPVGKPRTKLSYLNLTRSEAGERFRVRPFQQKAKQAQQALIWEHCRELIRVQQLDTTLHLIR